MEKALSWEIDNLSIDNLSKVSTTSDPFTSGGCEWFVTVNPKEFESPDHFTVLLHVLNAKSLKPAGWKTSACYFFVLLDQSGKELCRSPYKHKCRLFRRDDSYYGYGWNLARAKCLEQEVLENNKLTLEVYIDVLEVVIPRGVESTKTDMLDFHGFRILSSQADSVGKIYSEHPDFATDFKQEKQEVKTAYMNRLLGLIETLSKSPQSLSLTELTKAQSKLGGLTGAGFKVDWLNSKLEEVFLERKKALPDGSWVDNLEERVGTMELTLSDLKVELDKEKKVEERLRTMELTVSDLRVELDKEKKVKSAAAIKLSSFEVIDFLIKRFFLSCFSISKY